MLFDFITSEVFLQNDISTHIKQNFDQIKTIKVEEFQDISTPSSSVTEVSESKLELGKPLQFDKNETF